MSVSTIENVAAALVAARRSRVPTDHALLADALATPDDAYAVQHQVAQAFGWCAGAAPGVWKSGGASRTALQTHALLPPDGVTGPLQQACPGFFQRGIEAEIALRLGCDVDASMVAGLDSVSAGALCDAMTVSVEIVASRWRSPAQAPMLLKLADQQSHGALMLGAWQPFAARDWASQVCTVTLGDEPAGQWRGSHSMGDPCQVLPRWLAHATRDGQRLAAGSVVTTGTWCGLLDGTPGQSVTVAFDGIGSLAFRFAG